jgi:hypothetical protein
LLPRRAEARTSSTLDRLTTGIFQKIHKIPEISAAVNRFLPISGASGKMSPRIGTERETARHPMPAAGISRTTAATPDQPKRTERSAISPADARKKNVKLPASPPDFTEPDHESSVRAATPAIPPLKAARPGNHQKTTLQSAVGGSASPVTTGSPGGMAAGSERPETVDAIMQPIIRGKFALTRQGQLRRGSG